MAGKCGKGKGKCPAQMEKFQKDQEVPVHGASEEFEEASGVELDVKHQPEIIGDDGSETHVHDPRVLLGPDIDSWDQVVLEYLEDPGNLEESNLVCDENIDYDSQFLEDNLADAVMNLQRNDYENSTDERSKRRGGTGLEEVTYDIRAEVSTQVADDLVVSNLQNESPGQLSDGEDLLEVLVGDILDQETMDELLTEIKRRKKWK